MKPCIRCGSTTHFRGDGGVCEDRKECDHRRASVPVGTCAVCNQPVPSGTRPDHPERAVYRGSGPNRLHHFHCAPKEQLPALAVSVIDAKGDQVPAVGWRDAAARNRIDGALRAAMAACAAAVAIVEEEEQHRAAACVGPVYGSLGAAVDDLGDAEMALRRVDR